MEIRKTKEMNETNLAQHFFNSIYLSANYLMKAALFVMYIFIGAKVSHTSSKNAG